MERAGACAIFNKERRFPRPSEVSSPMRQLFCALIVAAAPVLAQCPPPPNTSPSVSINCVPTREFGQPTLAIPLESAAPNLVEGRELYQPRAIAFDNSVTP